MLKLVARTEYRVFGFLLIFGLAAALLLLTNIPLLPDESLLSVDMVKKLDRYLYERWQYGMLSLGLGLFGVALLLIGDHYRHFDFGAKNLTLTRYPFKVFKRIVLFESLQKIVVIERHHRINRYARIANIRVRVGSHTFYTYELRLLTNKGEIIRLTKFPESAPVEAYAAWLAAQLGVPAFYVNARQRGVGLGEISLANSKPVEIPSFVHQLTIQQKVVAALVYGGVLLALTWGYLIYPAAAQLHTLSDEGELRHLSLTGLFDRRHRLFDFDRDSTAIQHLGFSRHGEDLFAMACSRSSISECIVHRARIVFSMYDLATQNLVSSRLGAPAEWFSVELAQSSPDSTGQKIDYADELCARKKSGESGDCFMNFSRSVNGQVIAIAFDSGVSVFRFGYLQPFLKIALKPRYGLGENAVKLSYDGRYLAISSGEQSEKGDRQVTIWNTDQGKQVMALTAWPRTQAQIAWSPKQYHLAVAEYGSLEVFDALSGKIVRQYETHSQKNTALAWHPDGKTLYTGAGDGLIHVWQAPR